MRYSNPIELLHEGENVTWRRNVPGSGGKGASFDDYDTEALQQAIKATCEEELRKTYPDAEITDMKLDIDPDNPRKLRVNATYTTGTKTKNVKMTATL